jgi:hypothetical protein
MEVAENKRYVTYLDKDLGYDVGQQTDAVYFAVKCASTELMCIAFMIKCFVHA